MMLLTKLLLLGFNFAVAPLAAQGSLVIDLKPGGGFGGSGFAAAHAIPLGGELLFAGDDGAGRNLWTTNGTVGGTHLVHDIYPGVGSVPMEFTALGDKVVFRATDPVGWGLWVTDGTAGGTVKLADAGLSVDFGNLVLVGEEVFFQRNSAPMELWKTDGTAAGTGMVLSSPTGLSLNAAFQGEVYYTAIVFGALGYHELWKTDGTPTGAVLLHAFGASNAAPADFTVAGDKLFFTAHDALTGRELWMTDGTVAGTSLLLEIGAGTASGNPENLQALDNGLLLFSDWLGLFGPARRLWVSDGSVAGTSVLYSNATKDVLEVASVGAEAYFIAFDELWQTDGTVAGTSFVTQPVVLAPGSDLVPVGNGSELVFRASGFGANLGQEPWFFDGQQVAMLLDIHPGPGSSNARAFHRVGNLLFFAADDGVTGTELHAVPIADLGAWVGQEFGAGCGVGGSTPRMSVAGVATAGSLIQIDLSEAAPSAATILFVSTGRSALPVGSGCSVYLAVPQVLMPLATDPVGMSSLPIMLPATSALVGIPLYLQTLVAAPGGPLLGMFELSSGVELVIGQ
tara:strand:- start:805 stop:2508 length:1704 start_codon:yes stop_codon:yes gene_type:complete